MIVVRSFVFMLILLAMAGLSPAFAATEDVHPQESSVDEEGILPESSVTAENVFSFATMPGGTTGAVFMTIRNAGNADDRLISAIADVAETVEIHENIIDEETGTMSMRPIEGIDIPAGGEAVLEPKGNHIMLIGLKEPLTIDSNFPLTLIFEQAGEQTLDVHVVPPGKLPEGQDMTHDEHMSHHHDEE